MPFWCFAGWQRPKLGPRTHADADGADDVEVSLDSPRMANVASTRMTVGRACQNFASPLVDELVGGKPRVAVKTVLTARAFQKGLAK